MQNSKHRRFSNDNKKRNSSTDAGYEIPGTVRTFPLGEGPQKHQVRPPEHKRGIRRFTCSWDALANPKLTAGLSGACSPQANEGAPSELAALYRNLLEKEPTVTAHMATRILAVLACDWTIQGTDARRTAEVRAILEKAGLHALMRHLLDALGARLLRRGNHLGRRRRGHLRIQESRSLQLAVDLSGNPALMTVSGKIRSLAEYHPNQFVLHSHKLQSGISSRGGLLRPLVWLYFFKHYAMRDRARYLEKFGIPVHHRKNSRRRFRE